MLTPPTLLFFAFIAADSAPAEPAAELLSPSRWSSLTLASAPVPTLTPVPSLPSVAELSTDVALSVLGLRTMRVFRVPTPIYTVQ